MNKRILILAVVLLTLFAVPAFAAKKANTVRVSGSTTVLPIAQAAAETFMDRYPEVNLTVRGGGSSVGIANIISGTTDIGDASRQIKNKEIVQARSNGINPVEHIVANDGIAIILHKDNNVKELSIEQIQAIYTGKITNWSEVGGPNKPIVIISRDVASGTFEVFNTLILAGQKQLSGALMLASNNAVATTVADTPGAIGYCGFGYLTDRIHSVKVNGINPSIDTIKSGSYPVARKLYMYTNGNPKGWTEKFINFIKSAEGQKIVEEQGFISL
jgi:phosphate transport system substrate-binding protein